MARNDDRDGVCVIGRPHCPGRARPADSPRNGSVRADITVWDVLKFGPNRFLEWCTGGGHRNRELNALAREVLRQFASRQEFEWTLGRSITRRVQADPRDTAAVSRDR